MNRSTAQTTTDYALNKPATRLTRASTFKLLAPALQGQGRTLFKVMLAVLVTTGANLITPFIIAHTIDTHLAARNYQGLMTSAIALLGVFSIGLFAGYVQAKAISELGRYLLFNLRSLLFNKLQSLPFSFFNQNKSGDIIARVNHDTNRLNSFLVQSVSQLISNTILLTGAAISLILLDARLGLACLIPAALVLLLLRVLPRWTKHRNAQRLRSFGEMTAEIQDSLSNFKAIVALNRRDYFRQRLKTANEANLRASINAGLANHATLPIGGLAGAVAQIIILAYGISLIAESRITLGLLIASFLYANRIYFPLRQITSIWGNSQQASAACDRIAAILAMEPDMHQISDNSFKRSESILSLRNVSFCYPGGKMTLTGVNLELQKGKTYALVGPTGGGKTTAASLMARLYDPAEGEILLDGADIRSFSSCDRTRKIGFVQQEPILFGGTVLENIFYGNGAYAGGSPDEWRRVLHDEGLDGLLKNFGEGLEFTVQANGENISIGQRQIIAFARAVLRKPEVLILDEATANIDTMTEQLLQNLLQRLPLTTTKIIIAHRFKTIENADDIFFVNEGKITHAGSFGHAMEMLQVRATPS